MLPTHNFQNLSELELIDHMYFIFLRMNGVIDLCNLYLKNNGENTLTEANRAESLSLISQTELDDLEKTLRERLQMLSEIKKGKEEGSPSPSQINIVTS